MLETFNSILADIIRNLKRNIKSSPILYFLFFIMIIFSIAMIAMLTMFFIEKNISINISDVFFVIFFMFMIKTSVDFYRYYIDSKPLIYVLSSPISNLKILFNIFILIFLIQLGLWVFFSSIYHFFIYSIGISLSYPILYLQFLFGVILSIILGIIIPIHFFSKKKFRLTPVGFLLIGLWLWNDIVSIILITILSILYLIISFNFALDSYQYVNRKKRKKEILDNWKIGIKKTIFLKETIILWREKLLIGILFTSVSLGFFSGYFAVFGDSSFLPESLKIILSLFSREIYAFFGIYIMTIYASVFISLNLFLNEENTIWIFRNMPISEKTLIYGKGLSLIFPFICSIPFIAYFSAFTQGESLFYLIWFFIFSYLAGVIISFPLGVIYLGKKSDILLLYSLSMIILIILGISYFFTNIFYLFFSNNILFYILILVIEIIFLYLSFELSTHLLSNKNLK